jgi:guanosine-3',5'-bis(diphosphate) 3'-pyrophosphohydrolase
MMPLRTALQNGDQVEIITLQGAGRRRRPGNASSSPARRAPASAASSAASSAAGMAVHFAGCCHPLPGDRIVGIVTTGRGVTIHKNDCHGLEAFSATPERFIDVDWEYEGGGGGHVGRIELTAENKPGALAGLTTAIAKQDGAVNNLRIVNRSGDWCDVLVDVEVRDTAHLASILAALRACNGVTQVERAKG